MSCVQISERVIHTWEDLSQIENLWDMPGKAFWQCINKDHFNLCCLYFVQKRYTLRC